MRPRTRHPLTFAVALLAIGGVSACAGEAINAPTTRAPGSRAGELALDVPRLIDCGLAGLEPIAELDTDTNGGSLAVGREQLRVPSGAVHGPVRLSMVTPVSANVELELHAVGFSSYTFKKPVTVRIDYSRCDASAIASEASLRVVHIDPVTRAVLQDMGGTVDPVARTITFETDHFSSYAVAD